MLDDDRVGIDVVGCDEGWSEGEFEGALLGCTEGDVDGLAVVGLSCGALLGPLLGLCEGDWLGLEEGPFDGEVEGSAVTGDADGDCVGLVEGDREGDPLGDADGDNVGDVLGLRVGCGVVGPGIVYMRWMKEIGMWGGEEDTKMCVRDEKHLPPDQFQ